MQVEITVIETFKSLRNAKKLEIPNEIEQFYGELSNEDLERLGKWYDSLGKLISKFVSKMQTKAGRDEFYKKPKKVLKDVGLTSFIFFTSRRIDMVISMVKHYSNRQFMDDAGMLTAAALGCFTCTAICLFCFFAVAILGVTVTAAVAGLACIGIAALLGASIAAVWAAISLQIGMAAFTVSVFVCRELSHCK